MKTPTILLVEDEALFADTLALTLKKSGYRVLIAHGAQAAIDILDDHKAELIVLDIFLPEGNGIQLLHEFKTHQDTVETPIIICTSAYDQMPKEILHRYGVIEVLDKSKITSEDLRVSIKSVLNR